MYSKNQRGNLRKKNRLKVRDIYNARSFFFLRNLRHSILESIDYKGTCYFRFYAGIASASL